MEPKLRISINLTIFAIYAALYSMWQFFGLDGARNVLVIALWIVSVIAIIVSPLPSPKNQPAADLRRSALETTIGWACSLTIFSALAWVGETTLAATYLIACLMTHGSRVYDLKKAEEAEKALPNNLLIISGGPGSGKTSALKAIGEYWIERYGSDVLYLDPAITQSALINRISASQPKCAILDEVEEGCGKLDLAQVAKEFPGVRFIAAK